MSMQNQKEGFSNQSIVNVTSHTAVSTQGIITRHQNAHSIESTKGKFNDKIEGIDPSKRRRTIKGKTTLHSPTN